MREIEGQGGRAACFPADLGNADAARALAGRVADELGQLDVLVNSAAVMHHVSFEDTTPELFDEVLHLNLRSVFFVSQGAAPFLRKAGGKIVNLADLGGLEPWPGYAAHSISKAGVVMLTRILARSLAPEVTVNAIAPGAVLVPSDYSRRRAHPARRNDTPQAARDTGRRGAGAAVPAGARRLRHRRRPCGGRGAGLEVALYFTGSFLECFMAVREQFEVVIVGGGPAGLCAALYGGRGMLRTVLLERGVPGR